MLYGDVMVLLRGRLKSVLTRKSTDAILATQGFALAVCVDFNNLYFIFSVCIGIPELFIYRSKGLSKPVSSRRQLRARKVGWAIVEI